MRLGRKAAPLVLHNRFEDLFVPGRDSPAKAG